MGIADFWWKVFLEAAGIFFAGMGWSKLSIVFIVLAFLFASFWHWKKSGKTWRDRVLALWDGLKASFFAACVVFAFCLLKAPYTMFKSEELDRKKAEGALSRTLNNKSVDIGQIEKEKKFKIREQLANLIEEAWKLERQVRGIEGTYDLDWVNRKSAWEKAVQKYLKINLDASYVEGFNHPTVEDLSKTDDPKWGPYQGQDQSMYLRQKIEYLKKVVHEQK